MSYTIIATPHCPKCKRIRQRMIDEGIDHEYKLITNLPTEDQEHYKLMAMDAGVQEFPIVLNDEGLIVRDIEKEVFDN